MSTEEQLKNALESRRFWMDHATRLNESHSYLLGCAWGIGALGGLVIGYILGVLT